MMMSWIAIAVLAGLASALIFAAAGIPTFAAAAVFLLAPAPLLIAGLGWGLLVTLTAGLAGAVVLAVLIGWAFAVPFLLSTALPAVVICRLALQRAAGGAGRGRRRRSPRRRCRVVSGRPRADRHRPHGRPAGERAGDHGRPRCAQFPCLDRPAARPRPGDPGCRAVEPGTTAAAAEHARAVCQSPPSRRRHRLDAVHLRQFPPRRDRRGAPPHHRPAAGPLWHPSPFRARRRWASWWPRFRPCCRTASA